MQALNESIKITTGNDYLKRFWNHMRGNAFSGDTSNAFINDGNGYLFPDDTEKKFRKELEKQSSIRSIAKTIKLYVDGKVKAYDSDDQVQLVRENQPIPGFDVDEDFEEQPIGKYKFAGLFKAKMDYARDASFGFEDYIIKRMAKSFGKAEDNIFINGYGPDDNEPCGLADNKYGAMVGATTGSVTYDDCLDLFYSVKPEYRKNATWLMNDKTALALRKLKDNAGNYLWNSANDTILGRPVCICNEMPDAKAGYIPIYFGDFDYYWIIDRSPMRVKVLTERFMFDNKIGYIGSEFLDSVLVRRDAVKALRVSGVPDEDYIPREY